MRSPPSSSPAVRAVMRANRGDVALRPERRLRAALHELGFSGWSTNAADLPGKPDVLFPNDSSEVDGRRYGHVPIAVFVDGCYWHRCPAHGSVPRTNAEFWSRKFEANRRRDRRADRALVELGYTVVRGWECTVRRDLGKLLRAIRDEMVRGRRAPRVVRLLPTRRRRAKEWLFALDDG